MHGNDDGGQPPALEAERLHALIDGLAVNAEQIVAVVRLHLDALDNATGLAKQEQSA